MLHSISHNTDGDFVSFVSTENQMNTHYLHIDMDEFQLFSREQRNTRRNLVGVLLERRTLMHCNAKTNSLTIY